MKLLRVLAAVLAAALLAGSFGPATPPAAAAPSPLPDQARFSFRVTTTSDWTGVYAWGLVASHTVVTEAPAGVSVSPRNMGFVVSGAPTTGATVEVEVAFEAPPGATEIVFFTHKGNRGYTVVDVVNLTRPRVVLHGVNRARGAADGRNQATWKVPRAQVFGEERSRLPKADDRPLVLAYYYPWFSEQSYDKPTLTDTPRLPFSAWDGDDVDAQVKQAAGHGIDGFVVAWQGDTKNGRQFDHVVEASERHGSKATVLIETATANAGFDPSRPSDPAVVKRWLSEALARASSPSFLRQDDVPVAVVFDMGRLGAAAWRDILDELAAEGTPVRLVGDTNTDAYRSLSIGYHRYDVNLAGTDPLAPAALAYWNQRSALTIRGTETPRIFAATVSPGFDKSGLVGDALPIVDRGLNGSRYRDTWEAAHGVDPDWVFVTSWNEWYEATNVQPSTRFGSRALEQTAYNSWRFKQA